MSGQIPHEVKAWHHVSEWQFTALNNRVTCRIDNKKGLATVKFFGSGKEFPDCLKVQHWLDVYAENNPTTAEELCVAAVQATGMDCEVEWVTDSHGPIRVRINAATCERSDEDSEPAVAASESGETVHAGDVGTDQN